MSKRELLVKQTNILARSENIVIFITMFLWVVFLVIQLVHQNGEVFSHIEVILMLLAVVFPFVWIFIDTKHQQIEDQIFALDRVEEHVHHEGCQHGAIQVVEVKTERFSFFAGGGAHGIADVVTMERTRCSECGSEMIWTPSAGRQLNT